MRFSAAAPAARSIPLSDRSTSTKSKTNESPVWTVPSAAQKPFTTTLREGDWVNLEWEGGKATETVDLWLASTNFATFHFSQLITKQVNLSSDGEFNWTVHVPQAQLDATPQYTLMFKAARSDFQFNSTDPGFPSPGVVILPPGAGPTNATTPVRNEKDHGHDDAESESDGESDSGDDESDNGDEEEKASGLQVSTNATCGGSLTCLGSSFGNCCSQFSFCGATAAYCEAGCQSGFGDCDPHFLSVAATAASNSTNQPSHQLSAAATAGVATGLSVCVAAMGILAWFWLRKYRERQAQQKKTQEAQMMNKYFGDDGDDSGASMAERLPPYPRGDNAYGLPAPTKAYYAGAIPPVRSMSSRTYTSQHSYSVSASSGTSRSPRPSTSSRSPPNRQSEIYEMHGGEKPYEYGRSPPAELYGSSIKEEAV